MEKRIAAWAPGDRIAGPFLIRESRLVDFKNKPGRYLHLVLADRSGEIEARLWEDGETHVLQCQSGSIVFFTGEVVSFNNALQLKLTSLRSVEKGEYQQEDFVPAAPRPIADMRSELAGIVAEMKPGSARTLAEAVLKASWFETFLRAPAAKKNHHNYLGGLLEHTLGVMRLAKAVGTAVPNVDRDLLITGALLHDIGKTREMNFFPGIEYTDEGRLIGHIVLGIQMTEALMEPLGLPESFRLRIQHMLASHHGEYEWQSPKRPKFVEARLLHLIDLMDADVFKFQSVSPDSPGSHWSAFVRNIGNPVFLGLENEHESVAYFDESRE
ncbi:MAG: 3'-5' exoribonuclease YhaM family protein [Solirubrobacterales bacterium]